MSQPVIQMTDITKDFPGVKALDAVPFFLEKGKCGHSLGRTAQEVDID